MSINRLRVIATSLILAVALIGLGQWLPGDRTSVPPGLASGVFTPHTLDGVSYRLYVPPDLPTDRPTPVLVAIHGMGGEPESFAGGLVDYARENGWILVAPHLPYGDWTHADALKAEEKRQMAWLDSLLASLPAQTGRQAHERALLYGFSRGGQLAHRFALAYPQRVMAAAIMSPGTYTLPIEQAAATGNDSRLEFPVGVGDIDRYCGKTFNPDAVREVRFWIGVGEMDNAPGDVPRMWDRYLGQTRLERARSFAASLEAMGAEVKLRVFPGLGHAESLESRGDAATFLEETDFLCGKPTGPEAEEDLSTEFDGNDEIPATLERFALALMR